MLPLSSFWSASMTNDERRARAWWATLSSADRAERQDELHRQLDGFGIEHPTDERGWIMAAWESENA
jgi:hypothetical protein